MQRDGRGRDFVFWLTVLVAGGAIFVLLLLPAMRDARRTTSLKLRLEEENSQLREERDRLFLRRDALESDPDEVLRALRDQGFTPEGEITVVLDAPEDR